MKNGNQIVFKFIKILSTYPEINITPTYLSKNVYELSGKINCLLYVKAIAKSPHRWGVTANVVDRIERQSKNWFTILLFDTENTGYLLTAQDVAYYIKKVWPKGTDGDYKTSPGTYLANNSPFRSIDEFIDLISTKAT